LIAPGGNILQGTMTMNFYEVPKPAGFKENNEEWMWEDLMKSGKNNPFSTDGSTVYFNTIKGKYDFTVSVMPDSSDLPSIIVGKSDDDSRSSYLYADSNSVENVSFSFKSENNKYLYKYNSKDSAYPIDGSWKEFTPVSDGINIKVISSARNSKADSAGE